MAEIPDDDWVETFCNSPLDLKHAGKPHPTRRVTPHSALKHKCRAALTAWRQKLDVPVVLLPSFVGTITAENGKQYPVGKKGQADDTLLILSTAVCIEYKAGADRQSEHQIRHQQRVEATGCVYLLVRKPSDLTDALAQIAAQRGHVF